jgi:hypothetical protein
MKAKMKMSSIGLGRKLRLVASIITLAGSFPGMAANYLIVNETYDPPTLTTPGGWEYGVVENLSRQYVSEGVGHTTALQISATFPGPDYGNVASAMYQSGVASGNEWATRDNTVLTFDLKVDAPGLAYVGIHLDAFTHYQWVDLPAGYTGALIPIALGAYQPGVFKRIVVPLNDPNALPFDTAPLFDPSARTYNNVTLVVDSTCLPLPGSFKVTVDNVKVTTQNAMIPFGGTSRGAVEFLAEALSITEHGVAEHIGAYKAKYILPYASSDFGSAEVTAANGDKLIGTFIYGWGDEYGVQVTEGTGRFQGAVGSYRGLITSFDETASAYTVTLQGGLSTVGSNK